MTLRPRDVVEGAWLFGKRSWARKATAMTELRVVRGSWPMPASSTPVRRERGVGMLGCGCHRLKVGRSGLGLRVDRRAVMPMRRIRRA